MLGQREVAVNRRRLYSQDGVGTKVCHRHGYRADVALVVEEQLAVQDVAARRSYPAPPADEHHVCILDWDRCFI